MAADQASHAAGNFLAFGVAIFALVVAIGVLGDFGKSGKEGGSGFTTGKAFLFIFVGLLVVGLLQSQGTGKAIAGSINAMWGNILDAVEPLVEIAFTLAITFAIAYVVWLIIKNRWRR